MLRNSASSMSSPDSGVRFASPAGHGRTGGFESGAGRRLGGPSSRAVTPRTSKTSDPGNGNLVLPLSARSLPGPQTRTPRTSRVGSEATLRPAVGSGAGGEAASLSMTPRRLGAVDMAAGESPRPSQRPGRAALRATSMALFGARAMARGDEEEGLLRQWSPDDLRRSVSMNALDRSLLLVDFLQLYALLWVASRLWPFPYFWTAVTRFALAATADATALDHFRAVYQNDRTGVAARDLSPWGEWAPYPWAAIAAAVLAATPVLAYAARIAYLRRGPDDRPRARAALKRPLVIAGQVLALPVAVNVARVLRCRPDGGLEVAPATQCGGPLHSAALAAAAVAAAALLLLCWLLWSMPRRHVVRRRAQAHERYLRWKELEFVLELNDDWYTEHVDATSSYNRHAHLYRLAALFEKLLLLAANTALRNAAGLQGVLYFAVPLAAAAGILLFPPFRNRHSNQLALTLQLALAYFGTFGMLKATGGRSSLLVSSALTVWLFLGLALFGAVVLVVLALGVKAAWAGDQTWPTTRASAAPQHHRAWVAACHDAAALLYDIRFAAPEVVPMGRLRAHAVALRRHVEAAAAAGSPLEWSLVDSLQHVSIAISRYEDISFLPYRDLEDILPAFVRRLRQRRYERLLMSPRGNRMLTKLLALRLFLLRAQRGADSRAADSVQPADTGIRAPVRTTASLSAGFGASRLLPPAQTVDDVDRDELLRALEDDAGEEGAGGEWTLLGFSLGDIADSLARDTERVLQPPRQLDELQRVRQLWKRLIKRWEARFRETHDGEDPTVREKRSIKAWYAHHKSVAVALREGFGTWDA